MKVSRISRIIRILTILKAEKPYSVNDLAEMVGISRRTVFRDLDVLRTIGVQYHYDAKTASYTIEPGFFLPPIDLETEEALSLLLLVYKAGDEMQLPLKTSAVSAALKIVSNLPLEIKQYCNTTLQNISIRHTPQAPMKLLDKIFVQLQKAIDEKRKLLLRYHSLHEGGIIIEHYLCPYRLMFHHRAWYVVGFESMHNSIRTFKLNRIKDLKATNERFTQDSAFELNKHFGLAWFMITEGKIYNVKLRFSPKVATNVTEVHWHSTQKVTHNIDGSVIVEFQVDGLGEIAWWILGYGDQVEVLQPKKLRKKIVNVAENMIKVNQLT